MKKYLAEVCPNSNYGLISVHPKYKEAAILAMQASPFIDMLTSYTGMSQIHVEWSPLVEDSDIEGLRAILKRITEEGADQP